MGDIEFFKKTNGQFGHDMGDCILKQVADIIKEETRKVDFLARWGGEAFLIVLPETNLAGGVNVAESIRKVIQNKKFGFKGNEISISLSFGVGCHTGKGIKLDKLLEMADERLCTAKNGGRNQVVST